VIWFLVELGHPSPAELANLVEVAEQVTIPGKAGGTRNRVATQQCEACDADAPELNDERIGALKGEVPEWDVVEEHGEKRLVRELSFRVLPRHWPLQAESAHWRKVQAIPRPC
jgi:hypothetical protein